jgi:hypothetical protein
MGLQARFTLSLMGGLEPVTLSAGIADLVEHPIERSASAEALGIPA